MTDSLGSASTSEEIAHLLSEYRKSQGITQSELAAKMGITQPSLARLESGSGDVKLSTLVKWSKALALTPKTTLDPEDLSGHYLPYQTSWDDGTFAGWDGTVWRYYQAPAGSGALSSFLSDLGAKSVAQRDIHLLRRLVPRIESDLPEALQSYLRDLAPGFSHHCYDAVGVRLFPRASSLSSVFRSTDPSEMVRGDAAEVDSLATQWGLKPLGEAGSALRLNPVDRCSTWVLGTPPGGAGFSFEDLTAEALEAGGLVDVSLRGTVGASRAGRLARALRPAVTTEGLSDVQVLLTASLDLPDEIVVRGSSARLHRFPGQDVLVSTLPTGQRVRSGAVQGVNVDPSQLGMRPVSPLGDEDGLVVGLRAHGQGSVRLDPSYHPNTPPYTIATGSPGGGKSTFLESLLVQAGRADIPFVHVDPLFESSEALATITGGEVVDLNTLPSGALDPFSWCPEPSFAAEVATDLILGVLGSQLSEGEDVNLATGLRRGALDGADCLGRALDYVDDNARIVELVRDATEASHAFSLGVAWERYPTWELPARAFVRMPAGMNYPVPGAPGAEMVRMQRISVNLLKLVDRFAMDDLLARGGGMLFLDKIWDGQVEAVLRDQGRATRCPKVHVVAAGVAGSSVVVDPAYSGSHAAFRSVDAPESIHVLEDLGLVPSEHNVKVLRDLPVGTALYRDQRGEVGHVRVVVAPELRERHSTERVPESPAEVPCERPRKDVEAVPVAPPVDRPVVVPVPGSVVDVVVGGNLLAGRVLVSQRILRNPAGEVIPGAVEVELQTPYGSTEVVPLRLVERIDLV